MKNKIIPHTKPMRINMTLCFASSPIALGRTEVFFMAVVVILLPSCASGLEGRDPADESSGITDMIVGRAMEQGYSEGGGPLRSLSLSGEVE